ncbi:MAG: DUF4857 domain-containing protein [Bacteroidales bacterium]|nr:DUF4857 domain-containing protein [Bacteroidales bacterium]
MRNTIHCLIITATLLLAWFLPWIYKLITADNQSYPFTYFSCINKSFCYLDMRGEEIMRMDAKGRVYTEAEFDSILPMFYYRQLIKDDRLPDSINNVAISPRQISTHSFFFRYRPADMNTPGIKLYPLFESMGKRVDLKMPGDVFRFNNAIEFINPENNKVLAEKSMQFNKPFIKRDFAFPPRLVAGNPSIRKAYDEGWFIIDQHYRVFHMKMVNGMPFVKDTRIDSSLQTKYIATTEYPSKLFYGFLFDNHNQLYVISTENYKLIPVPTPAFSMQTDEMLIMGNMFYWNIEVTSDKGQTTCVVDVNTFKKSDSISFPAAFTGPAVQKWIFPFTLSFTSPTHKYVMPRIEVFGFGYLISGIMFAAVYYILYRKKIRSFNAFLYLTWIALTGIFGFISLITINPLKQLS